MPSWVTGVTLVTSTHVLFRLESRIHYVLILFVNNARQSTLYHQGWNKNLRAVKR